MAAAILALSSAPGPAHADPNPLDGLQVPPGTRPACLCNGDTYNKLFLLIDQHGMFESVSDFEPNTPWSLDKNRRWIRSLRERGVPIIDGEGFEIDFKKSLVKPKPNKPDAYNQLPSVYLRELKWSGEEGYRAYEWNGRRILLLDGQMPPRAPRAGLGTYLGGIRDKCSIGLRGCNRGCPSGVAGGAFAVPGYADAFGGLGGSFGGLLGEDFRDIGQGVGYGWGGALGVDAALVESGFNLGGFSPLYRTHQAGRWILRRGGGVYMIVAAPAFAVADDYASAVDELISLGTVDATPEEFEAMEALNVFSGAWWENVFAYYGLCKPLPGPGARLRGPAPKGACVGDVRAPRIDPPFAGMDDEAKLLAGVSLPGSGCACNATARDPRSGDVLVFGVGVALTSATMRRRKKPSR